MLKGEEELDAAGTADYEYYDDDDERKFQTSTPLNNRFPRSKSNGNYYQSPDQYTIEPQSNTHQRRISTQSNGYSQPHHYRGASRESATTKSLDPRDRLIASLQKDLSQVAFENEELKHEIKQAQTDVKLLATENDELREQIQQLYQDNQQKDFMRQKMSEKLAFVTQAAFTLCEKLSALKCRYYEEKNNAWLNGSATKK